MTCPCRSRKAAPAAQAKPATFTVTVRADGHPLACERCLEKHLCKALVYSCEAQEDERPVERGLARANLLCAAEHAEALGRPSSAIIEIAEHSNLRPESIREILPGGGDYREEAIGLLSVAEDALRLYGDPETAEAVRLLRIKFQRQEKSP